MKEVFSNEYFMKIALQEAEKGLRKDEVPIGAIITIEKNVIAKAHNSVENLNDVTAHAEMLAITAASNYLGSKYLNECTLYVTLEPCIMCAGAIAWSQIGRLVFGASDENKGFLKYDHNLIHPKTIVNYGICEKECSTILKDFFKQKR